MSAPAGDSSAPAPPRDAYLAEALPYLPSILQLLDRDPTSPTAGCFDRSYWHFRTMDFPSGMAQELALPLALAWKHPFPGSRWHGEPRLREWVLAALGFAARSAHADGSCDDYYPFERALGATVYSLHALAASWRLVEADDPALRAFLAKRARFVAATGESGVLANHHAIAAAALQEVFRITGDEAFARAARAKAREVLGHQHAEGWFREYEGFDPGYQTVTVDFLARYWKDSGDDEVLGGLERAVALLERVQHPDGAFGGEYGSRSTYHAQPHGFEVLGPRLPAAHRVADRLLRAFAAGRRASNDDDRLLGHHVYPCLLAWLDWAPRREATPAAPPPERTLFPACGVAIDRRDDAFLVAGLKKGGPFRAWAGGRLLANDSGPVIELADGRRLVAHLAHDAEIREEDGAWVSRGRFHEAKRERMTPAKSVLLRVVMLTAGRFARTLVRRLLQKRLILGRAPAPFSFERRFERTPRGFRVTDTIRREPGAPPARRLHLGTGQTSAYIAVAQPWEEGWLLPWTDLTSGIPAFEREGQVVHVRTWDA